MTETENFTPRIFSCIKISPYLNILVNIYAGAHKSVRQMHVGRPPFLQYRAGFMVYTILTSYDFHQSSNCGTFPRQATHDTMTEL